MAERELHHCRASATGHPPDSPSQHTTTTMTTTRTFLRDEVVVGTCATHSQARKLVRLLSDSFTNTSN